MIKDNYLEKEISNYGGEKVFIVNSTFSHEKNIKNIPENVFICKIGKHIYTLNEEFAEENAYPYQALLFNFCQKNNIKNGIVIANHGEVKVVTLVKQSIPETSITIMASDDGILRQQINRFLTAQEISAEETFLEYHVTEENYNINQNILKTPFLYPSEFLQLQKTSFIREKVFLFGSIFLFAYYCLTSVPSTLEKNKLEQEITKLESQKESLKIQLTGEEGKITNIDYFNFKREVENTKSYLSKLAEILAKEPLLKVEEEGKQTQGNTLIVTDFSPNFKENLKKYKPQYTNNPAKIKITLD